MSKILIVPGIDGSDGPHWQAWWARTDPDALIVEQRHWSLPVTDEWENELAGAIIAHPGSLLVGHSLGAVLIARVLTTWPDLDVLAALLVAPAEPRATSRFAEFAPITAQALPVPATVVASRNDHWMPFSRAASLAATWGAELVDLGFAGHINVASGFGPWPRGFELAADLKVRARGTRADQRRRPRPDAVAQGPRQ